MIYVSWQNGKLKKLPNTMLTFSILTLCLGALLGMTRQSQMMKMMLREMVATVSQRGVLMRWWMHETRSAQLLKNRNPI